MAIACVIIIRGARASTIIYTYNNCIATVVIHFQGLLIVYSSIIIIDTI